MVWTVGVGEYSCGWLMLLWFCEDRIVCPFVGTRFINAEECQACCLCFDRACIRRQIFLDEFVHVRVYGAKRCERCKGAGDETTLIYLAGIVCIWCIAGVVVSVSVLIHHGEVVFGGMAKDLAGAWLRQQCCA